MNIQVTLLSLVVGFFMTIWSNDVQTRSVPVRALPPVKTYETPVRPVSISPAPVVAPTLPEGISPGRYQVVSHSGTSRTLELTASDIPRPFGPPRDFYIAQDGAKRWYFVRLDKGVNAVKDAAGETQVEIRRTASLATDSEIE